MQDTNELNNEFSRAFKTNIEDPVLRNRLVKVMPALANAVAFYEKNEADLIKATHLTGSDLKTVLETTAGIMAYHIKNDGPDYYGPEARNEKLAAIFTTGIKPALRNQATPTADEIQKRSELVKNNPELEKSINTYQTLENFFAKDGSLDQQNVSVLQDTIDLLGKQIRLRGMDAVQPNFMQEYQR